MKRLLLLLFIIPLFIACSNNDDNGGEGYLINLESAKSGILGSWKSTTGGIWYNNYVSNGTRCGGFEPNGNWDSCTTYEILKSGSDYILRIYVINSPSNNYDDWVINVLNEDEIVTSAKDGTQSSRQTRVK